MIRETFILYILLIYVCFLFLCWVKFCFRQAFFIWETKKVVAGCVRQVVVLYSNDCMGICLGGLSIGSLRRVVILKELVVWTGLTVYTSSDIILLWDSVLNNLFPNSFRKWLNRHDTMMILSNGKIFLKQSI